MKNHVIFAISLFLSPHLFAADNNVCINKLDAEQCYKIGQMLIVGFHGDSFTEDLLIAKQIKSYHLGGVILFRFNNDRNIISADQVARLNQQLKNYNELMQPYQQAALPLLITVDQEGGLIDRLPYSLGFAQITHTPQALGTLNDTNYTRQYAEQMLQVLQQHGFNVNLFPTVDVDINPVSPVIGGLSRSFSTDPLIVIEQARVFIDVFEQANVVSALKHFPGHGSASGDTHIGLVDVSDSWQQEELLPYQILINEGFADIVMSAHVTNTKLDDQTCAVVNKSGEYTYCPMTFSKKILTQLLRDDYSFSGVVISDDMTMGAMDRQYALTESIPAAINAGVDMLIFANHYMDYTEPAIAIIADAVLSGEIEWQRIEQAFQRIQQLKTRKL